MIAIRGVASRKAANARLEEAAGGGVSVPGPTRYVGCSFAAERAQAMRASSSDDPLGSVIQAHPGPTRPISAVNNCCRRVSPSTTRAARDRARPDRRRGRVRGRQSRVALRSAHELVSRAPALQLRPAGAQQPNAGPVSRHLVINHVRHGPVHEQEQDDAECRLHLIPPFDSLLEPHAHGAQSPASHLLVVLHSQPTGIKIPLARSLTCPLRGRRE